MKYLTKDWYETMQRTDLHLLLKPSEEASAFSEEYFQKVYAEAEQEYLDLKKSVCNVDREAMAQGFENAPHMQSLDGTPATDKEREIATAFQRVFAEALRSAPPMVFDSDKEKAEYRRRFNFALERVPKKLPPEILERIADIRVFALDYAAPVIIEEVTAYCTANDQHVRDVLKSYRQNEKDLFPDGLPDFYRKFDWHDFPVRTSHFEGKDFVLEPSRKGHPCYTFKNAEILLQEGDVGGCFGLYDEIYPMDSGYELHLLLERNSGEDCLLFELILRCSDVVIS